LNCANFTNVIYLYHRLLLIYTNNVVVSPLGVYIGFYDKIELVQRGEQYTDELRSK